MSSCSQPNIAEPNTSTAYDSWLFMKTLKHSRANGRRLPLIAVCLLSLSPPLLAQTAKQLMSEACYNELYQRKHNSLWASHVQRRAAGHIHLEEEIETVDGPIRHLLSVDGHEPSPSERRQDNDQLRKLMQNPTAQLAMKKNREADEKKVDELLRAIPDAFLFEDRGNQGGFEKLAFRPNPAYNPSNYEETALHAMSGVVLIDLQEKRLADLSGTLTQQVSVGYGVIGQLKKGGTIEVRRVRLSPGIWKTSSSKIDIRGRIILFKAISKLQDETYSDFAPLASDTSIGQALQKIASK
jgi:hypothetical protein